jgi:hypothetical protein
VYLCMFFFCVKGGAYFLFRGGHHFFWEGGGFLCHWYIHATLWMYVFGGGTLVFIH